MAGDLKYQVQVDAQQGIQSLQKLQAEVSKVSTTFNGLKTAIAGLGLGALAVNAVQYAASLDDVASASGIALDAVVGFSKAVSAAGGTTEGALTAIGRFANYIDDVSTGNRKAQESFAALGISLNDVGTLSERDLLRKTIQGLAKIDDNAKRTALGMAIFGKSFNSVDFRQLNDGIDGFIQRAGPSAAAIKAAADAEQNFANAMGDFKTNLLSALKPISEFVANLKPETVEKFTKAVVDIGVALAALAGTLKILSALGAGFAALKGYAIMAAGGFATLAGTMTSLKIQWGGLTKDLAKGTGIFAALATTLAVLIEKRLPFIIAGFRALGPAALIVVPAVMALDAALEVLTGRDMKSWFDNAASGLERWTKESFPRLGAAIDALGEKLGLAPPPSVQRENAAETQRLKARAQAADEERKRQEAAAQKRRETQAWFEEALTREKQKIAENVSNYQLQTTEQLKKFELQTRLMRQSEEQKLVEEETAAAQEAYLKAIQPLLAQRQVIIDKGIKANELELATVKELDKALSLISKQFAEQEPMRQQAVSDRIKEMLAVREMAYWTEILTKQDEQRRAVSETVGDYMRGGLDRLREGVQGLENLKLTPLQRQLEDIRREEERIAKAAKERVAEQFTGPEGDITDAMGFAKALETVEATQKRITEERQRQAEQTYEQQRSFSQGWKEAFQEYAENATNAAQNAKSFFQNATKGMENAIVGFAKTGKFEWRGFVASLAEELLRSQVSKLIAQLFGAVGGGGGGNIFGTIGNFFAGFFANGGTIPAGKFGVVGERGPEFVTGPASVTPMGMGGTVVNYNINAVDAMSFKQMLARDPAFIHAVAEKGRSTIATRR